jgi:hypothetical protein
MLSGTRLRGNRIKRAEKYADEETESMLVDADSIKVFVENTPNLLPQGERKTLTQQSSSLNVKDGNAMLFGGRNWRVDISADVSEEGEREQDDFATNTTVRSSRKAKDPAFLVEDRESCFNPEIALSSPLSDCENDLFKTNFDKITRGRKVRNRVGENLSQIASEGWELCNENDHNESNFRFNDSMKKGAKNYSERHTTNAPKDDLTSSEDNLVFSDIFKQKIKSTTSCQQSRAKRQQNFRRVRSQSEKNVKNPTEHNLFTDFSLSDEESSDKSTLREFPWGKSTTGVLHHDNSTLRGIHPGESRMRSLSLEESSMGDLYSGKDALENRISEQSSKEDPLKLMEDSEDLVNELNTGGDEFTDSQGQRSFVCLVDQLTDLRVRQKFVAQYAGRRRRAVCEELEKALVWNDKCLYEHRRDLNIRKALSNMFL